MQPDLTHVLNMPHDCIFVKLLRTYGLLKAEQEPKQQEEESEGGAEEEQEQEAEELAALAALRLDVDAMRDASPLEYPAAGIATTATTATIATTAAAGAGVSASSAASAGNAPAPMRGAATAKRGIVMAVGGPLRAETILQAFASFTVLRKLHGA
jgi:hypothetical protein